MHGLRIMHLGWGFTPWRTGGLISYAEGVMRGQVSSGHRVSYFCAGRHLPWLRRPVLHRWPRDGVRMLEALNLPIPVATDHGTLFPARECDEASSEALFAAALARERPDVLHVQELAGLPSSLLEVAGAAGIPVVFTLQDYLPLCPTVKLLDHRGEQCRREQPGRDCAICCRGAPADTTPLVRHTAELELRRLRGCVPDALARATRPVHSPVLRRIRDAAPIPPRVVAPVPPAEYDRRRAVNVERLGRVDLLLAMSHRVAELYVEHGVAPQRLRTLHLTLPDIERLTPRRLEAPPRPVTFAAVNVVSVPKGAAALAEAVERLDAGGLGERYRLRAIFADPAVRERLERSPSVTVLTGYERDELDLLLDDVDVGIVPSIWEEAYAFAGVEFMAKAIPVVAMPVGGVTDYVVPGETGWLADRADGAALADALAAVASAPHEVLERHRSVRARRSELVKPFARHLAELEDAYREVIAGGAAPAATGAAA